MKKSQKAKSPNASVAETAKQLYESTSGPIITQLEELMVTGELRLRWDAAPCNYITKNKYKGINLVIIAYMQMLDPSLTSKYWMTCKQANKIGHRVTKGAASTPVVRWVSKKYENEEIDKDGNKQVVVKSGRLFPRVFNVFNLTQTSAAEEEVRDVRTTESFDVILEKLKTIMHETDVKFLETGNKACYSPLRHQIKMPPFCYFNGDTQELKEQFYLSTLCHELAHSTMQKLRPAHYYGFINQNPYEPISKALYGKEEVVAEITATLLCATLGIEKQVLPDHAAYIRGWLEDAKKESPLYFNTACKLASQAHDFLMSKIDPSYSSEEISNDNED